MIFSSFPVPIRNQIVNSSIPYPDLEQGGGKALSTIISNTYPIFISLAIIAVFGYFLIAGYQWLTAGGDEGKVQSARTRITNALIGLAIIASAFAVFKIIDRFFALGLTKSSNTGGGMIQDCTQTSCSCNGSPCSGYCDSLTGICHPTN